MAELMRDMETVINHLDQSARMGRMDEKEFRAVLNVARAVSRIPQMEREIFDLKLELGAVEGELQEIKGSGEIIDD